MDVEGVGCEDVDWIAMSQDMDQWQVLMNTAIHFLVV
jgi:hypothetical protein